MRIFLTLFLMAGVAFGQLTPQQIENNAAPYRFYSARDLAVANTYLMSVIVGMSQTAPAGILASASAWKAFSDRDLMNAQTYLLSQFAGSVVANAQSTNYGVLTTNGNNILISPNSTVATFTNAQRAIAIGSDFAIGSVAGNGIYIGGGGPFTGGGVSTNGIAIGSGAGASAFWDALLTQPSAFGGIAIGNQVDNFGPYSIIIASSGGNNYLGAGDYGCVFIGNENNDGAVSITNVQFLGNRASDISLKSRTAYIGSPGAAPLGGTTGIVFFASASTAPSVTIGSSNVTAGSVSTFQGNKLSLITSNVAVSPYLWTNPFTYNVVVYISGAGGGSNSIAQNGGFIGYMTNGCTLICQPGEYVWNTNGAAHPNFSIKPL